MSKPLAALAALATQLSCSTNSVRLTAFALMAFYLETEKRWLTVDPENANYDNEASGSK